MNHQDGYEKLLNALPIGVLDLDHTARIQYANPKAQKILGRTWPDLADCNWPDLVYGEDAERVIRAWNQALKLSAPLSCFYRIFQPNQEIIPIYMKADPQAVDCSQPLRYAGYIQEVRDPHSLDEKPNREIETELQQSEQRYQLLAESVPIGIYHNNAEGNCIYINRKTCEILDIDFENCLGQGWADRLHPDDAERMLNSWQEAFQRKDKWQDQYRFVHRDGTVVWVLAQCIFTFNEQGENTGSIGALTDISHQKQLEEKLAEANARLQQMAHIDGLTEIPNRRYFDNTLAQEWQRLKREGQTIALLMIDIDYFKPYNDTYGHLQGDRILKTVAHTLRRLVHRPADFVARYGGEEFACVLPATTVEGAQKIAQDIQAEIDRLAIPHQASEISPILTLSIGIGCQTPTSHQSPHTLIEIADQALYHAKRQGRNRIVLYG
ncbi:MAG: sensor domain-containing diguanylate cyclase [Prochlorotrichaceae cyanobacterium]